MAYDDEEGFQLYRAPVAAFLCRQWNAHNPAEKQIAVFELIYCMANKAKTTSLLSQQIFREPLIHLELSEAVQ